MDSNIADTYHDREERLADYEPDRGATFVATDTGRVFDGDGTAWRPADRTFQHLRAADAHFGRAPTSLERPWDARRERGHRGRPVVSSATMEEIAVERGTIERSRKGTHTGDDSIKLTAGEDEDVLVRVPTAPIPLNRHLFSAMLYDAKLDAPFRLYVDAPDHANRVEYRIRNRVDDTALVRCEAALHATHGNPDLTEAEGVWIHLDDPAAEVYLDDLRAVPTREGRPQAVLYFDDGFDGVFEHAFPVMEAHNCVGNLAAITAWLDPEHDGYIELDELGTLYDAGWSVISHSVTHRDLTDLDDAEVATELRESKRQLIEWGFRRGVDHFAAPFGAADRAVLDRIGTYYRTSTAAQADGVATAHSTAPLVHHRMAGDDLDAVRERVDLLADPTLPGDTIYLMFHDIDNGDWISAADFEALIAYLGEKGVGTVTIDDVWDQGAAL